MMQGTEDVAIPRVAATLLLVRDDPFEVLMVRRHAKATFASALVFPGGALDPQDGDDAWEPLVDGDFESAERAIRIAAVRETWEETALLIARSESGEEVAPPGERTDAAFLDLVRASGGRLPLADVHPFAHWITPEQERRRFDTRFFLTRAPRSQSPSADGGETVGLEWVNPADAVARTDAGERSIIFPTLMNLTRLAESADVASAIEAARTRPPFTVQPRIERRADESRWVVIPAEAGYGATERRIA